jgi:carboxyl-terminal processing protease
MKKKLFVLCCLPVMLTLMQCGPTQPGHDNEFEFCWEALYYFFIYQERLPEDPYVYSTPTALYASVYDPYTRYFTPTEAPYLLEALSTQSYNIGLWLDTANGQYFIKQVFPTSPGATGGLHDHDTLINANSTALSGLPDSQITEILSGDIGDTIRLDIKRQNTPLSITIVLAGYKAPSVLTDSIDANIAYLLLTIFSDSTINPNGSCAEFSDALDKTAWAKYTVLDLRHCPGGELEQCQKIVSQFVPENTQIIKMQERYYDEVSKTIYTRNSVLTAVIGQKALNRIFAVLVDDYTASASEILVSCLKERRAVDTKIFGQQTYGKGSGWMFFITPKKGIATVTGLLLTPLVNPSYNHIGIVPDVVVDTTANAEQIALADINNGALGKQPAYARYMFRSNMLHRALVPRFWYPQCVVKR